MFYDRFDALCAEKGVKPQRACIEMGMSRSLAAKWKATRTEKPSTEALEKMSVYFGKSMDEIMGCDGVDEEKEKPRITSAAGLINEVLRMSEVTKRIDAVLKERGISKTQFYADCDLTSSAYSQWNTGKTEPKPGTLRRISNYLNVNYEWISNGSGEKEKPHGTSAAGLIDVGFDELTEANKKAVAALIEQLLAGQSEQ